MAEEIDAGCVAFALAQTTLSMLVASGQLDGAIVRATADALETNGIAEMTEQEVGLLAGALRSSVRS